MHISRYALVLLLICTGGIELRVVAPESVNSIAAAAPLLGREYEFIDGRTFAELVGLFEIVPAMMIAARPLFAGISAIGSLFTSMRFLVIGCVLSAPPGCELTKSSPLEVARGQSCLNDIVLLGVSLWTAGEALFAAKMHCPSVRMAKAAR